ncbi:MAG: hypothetical protein AMXMBFR84_12320 [Candidatus Hydrogenedentota bacterium]
MSNAPVLDESIAERYSRDGFAFTPSIIPAELIARVIPRMDAVIRGEFATGVPPHDYHFKPGDPDEKLRKVDNAHLSDPTIYELISHPELGKWAAAVTGATYVQAWATQLLIKPPAPDQANSAGNVGWHQDKQYWSYWDGEVFTAWIAVSNVTDRSGCMCFARGSHQWGLFEVGDFFEGDIHRQRDTIAMGSGKVWNEAKAVLPPGAVSFHHRLTYHASGPNLESFPRLSFAVHMRTDMSRPIAQDYYTEHLDDPAYCPVIYQL